MVLATLTTTQGWMIGIMALMAAFGVCAGIFTAMGKKRNNK